MVGFSVLDKLGEHRQCDSRQDHQGAERIYFRADAKFDQGVDSQRQRGRSHACGELGDDKVIERKHESKQTPSDDARHQQRQRYLEESD